MVYVLPVEAGTGTTYGDGLLTVKNAGLQTTYQAIFVSPTFSAKPWYADHATNQTIWQETHFRSVVVPFIEARYPAIAAAADRLLLGFSKSGWGAFSMLLRHPSEFGRAFAFDSPLRASWNFDDLDEIVGTQANFENYRVMGLIEKQCAVVESSRPAAVHDGLLLQLHSRRHERSGQSDDEFGHPARLHSGAKDARIAGTAVGSVRPSLRCFRSTIRAVAEFARIRACWADSPDSGEFSYELMPTACGICPLARFIGSSRSILRVRRFRRDRAALDGVPKPIAAR